jgi:hypothetical protein
MAKYPQGTLEKVIRDIVIDVLAEKFSFGGRTTANQNEDINIGGNINRPRRRRRAAGKGRVTDPAKDKRLKQNRTK